ncbi:uncharacterized protein [Ptychodera flava]|uniref:uncharacterized protein isoform X2 n=1 Tax=Ptychodera flava TaxID=63121 RepID=UPI00396A717B
MPKSTSSLELRRESRFPPIHLDIQVNPRRPVKRGREAATSKSLPALYSHEEKEDMEVISNKIGAGLTPYRLPKLASTNTAMVSSSTIGLDELYKIDADDSRSNHLIQYVRHRKNVLQPPYTIAQLHRASNLMVPNFRSAHLAPLGPCPSVATSSDMDYKYRYRGELPKLRGAESVNSFERKLDEELQREHKRISWKLSPHNNPSFDIKAGNSFNGPYSREFTIHCTAPANWLKMKLKRQDTTLR